MEQLEYLPFKGQKQLFEKLERLAKVVNLNKKERAEYEDSLKVYQDNQGVLDYAIESGFEKGMVKGMVKGMAKGMAKGKAEGMAEGKAEGMAEGKAEGKLEGKFEVAAAMKRNGLDIQTITLYTGLTTEEIAAL